MVGLQTAVELLGGQQAVADVLGVNKRHVRSKLTCDRPITSEDCGALAVALREYAQKAARVADNLAMEAVNLEGKGV